MKEVDVLSLHKNMDRPENGIVWKIWSDFYDIQKP